VQRMISQSANSFFSLPLGPVICIWHTLRTCLRWVCCANFGAPVVPPVWK